MAAGRAFFDEQIAYLQRRDTDGLIDNHYLPDAVLISPERMVRGTQALKAYFRGYVEMLGAFTVESVDVFMETDGAILFEATVQSNLGRARVYDGFALRDGRISHHFSGVIQRL